MLANQSVHLSKTKQMQLGSYYTPSHLVDIVFKLISPYIKNQKDVVLFDNAAGCGAFASRFLNFDYRVADFDAVAVNFLKQKLSANKVFYTNSLINVGRETYNISNNKFLINLGNPPYNDVTSEYKNGLKGKNECDKDLFDRDLGVSFLKSFNKLKSDLICVLHPLSYLIKPTNFERLKEFKDNYQLKKGIIFSSSVFSGTGSTKFPIVIGLYERNSVGMNFEHIKNFEFDILDSSEKFILGNYETTDGYINKYPPRKNDAKISPINTYYYTFRDFNSLKRNASFIDAPHYNVIVVTIENLYQYAYLFALKNFFKSDNDWLYGNLSPIVNKIKLENNKQLFVAFALQSNKVLKNLRLAEIEKIKDYYFLNYNDFENFEEVEKSVRNAIKRLF
jgi:hypothetical protein